MSDQAQGPGWWQASDGRWYPPETHPNYKPAEPAAPQAPPTPPVVAPSVQPSQPAQQTPPATAAPASAPQSAPAAGAPVTGAAIPSGWQAPASPPAVTPTPLATAPTTTGQALGTTQPLRMNGSGERSKWPLVLGVVAVLAVLGIGLAAIMGGDDTVELGTETPTPAATAEPESSETPLPTAEPQPTREVVTYPDPEPIPEVTTTPDPEPTLEPDPDLDPPPLVVPEGDIPAGVPASPSGDLGTVGNPAAFGTVFAFEDFAVTITNVEYATQDMVSEYSDPPPAGSVYVVLTTDTTYYGGEAAAYGPVQSTVWIDDQEIFSWESDCYLSRGFSETYLFAAGQSGRSSLCFEIPEDKLSSATFVIDDYLDTRHFAVGATATQEAPSFTQAELIDRGPGSPAKPFSVGTVHEFEEWTGSIVTATDARDAGQLSPSAVERDGYIPLWVVAEYTYNGTEDMGFLPPSPVAAGTEVFNGYTDDFCILDYSTRDDSVWEVEPGKPVLVEACLSVPEDELSSVLLILYGDWTDTDAIYDLN